jgi:hypothetical protein
MSQALLLLPIPEEYTMVELEAIGGPNLICRVKNGALKNV